MTKGTGSGALVLNLRGSKAKHGKYSGRYPPGYRSKVQVDARKAAKVEKEKEVEAVREQLEKEKAQREKEKVKAVEDKRARRTAAWEEEAVRREKEAFEGAWYRAMALVRRRGGRQSTGVVAQSEMEAEWRKFEAGH